MSKKLDELINSGQLHGALLFYGEEDYLIKYYVDRIVETYVDEAYKDFNLIKIRRFESLESVADACETFPMFSEKKVVLVYESDLFKAREKEGGSGSDKKKKSSADDKFEAFLKNIPDFCIVIFIEKKVTKTKKTYKQLAKLGYAEEFEYSSPELLHRWVAKQFALRGKRVTKGAVETLVEYSDSSMFFLLNQVEKVCTFAMDRDDIVLDDITAVCNKTAKAVVFAITDAIGEKKPEKAMQAINEVMAQNEPVQKILIMVCNHIRRLQELKMLLSDGCSFDEAISIANIARGFVAKKYERQLRLFTLKELNEMVHFSMQLDVYNKSSTMSVDAALDVFVAMSSL